MDEIISNNYGMLLSAIFGGVPPGADLAEYIDLSDEMLETTNMILGTLSVREAGVMVARYGLEDGQPKLLIEIAENYALDPLRIRQIEAKTMSKLRHWSRAKYLRKFIKQ